ncbi:MAG TPA: hypothetical protein VGF75_04425 [Candidatus Saccharimonadales bacterium]|jgi:hypothetical protein
MSQERDINLKLSIYELVMVLERIMKKDTSLSSATSYSIVEEARKFARKDD